MAIYTELMSADRRCRYLSQVWLASTFALLAALPGCARPTVTHITTVHAVRIERLADHCLVTITMATSRQTDAVVGSFASGESITSGPQILADYDKDFSVRIGDQRGHGLLVTGKISKGDGIDSVVVTRTEDAEGTSR